MFLKIERVSYFFCKIDHDNIRPIPYQAFLILGYRLFCRLNLAIDVQLFLKLCDNTVTI